MSQVMWWLATLLLMPVVAGQAQSVQTPSVQSAVQTELVAEQRVADDGGGKEMKFVPATQLKQGDVVYYTVRIHNPGSQLASGAQVIQRVPANTEYIEGSAAATGAQVSFSVDGQNFAVARRLQTSNGVTAKPSQYTHIRWDLPYALQPGAVVLARFRAVFR